MLNKISGRNARNQRAKAALKIKNDMENGKKWGDLTNGELHAYDKAKSSMHGRRGEKSAGRKAKEFVNWAKNDRQEPGSNKVGMTGKEGTGTSKPRKLGDTSGAGVQKKSLAERLAEHKRNKNTKPKVNLKAGLIIGAGGLGLLGAAHMLHGED